MTARPPSLDFRPEKAETTPTCPWTGPHAALSACVWTDLYTRPHADHSAVSFPALRPRGRCPDRGRSWRFRGGAPDRRADLSEAVRQLSRVERRGGQGVPPAAGRRQPPPATYQ